MSRTFSAAGLSFNSLYKAPWMRNRKAFNDTSTSDWHAENTNNDSTHDFSNFYWARVNIRQSLSDEYIYQQLHSLHTSMH